MTYALAMELSPFLMLLLAACGAAVQESGLPETVAQWWKAWTQTTKPLL